MIELPEVVVLARQINRTLVGKRIKNEAYLGGSIYYCPDCQREEK